MTNELAERARPQAEREDKTVSARACEALEAYVANGRQAADEILTSLRRSLAPDLPW